MSSRLATYLDCLVVIHNQEDCSYTASGKQKPDSYGAMLVVSLAVQRSKGLSWSSGSRIYFGVKNFL